MTWVRRKGHAWVAIAVTVGCLVATAEAGAVTHYAGPGETDDSPCTAENPCNIQSAVELQPYPDEVVILPGTYDLQGDGVVVNAAMTVHGQDGMPRPRLVQTMGNAVTVNAAGATVRDLEIEVTGTASTAALSLNNTSTAERLYVHGSADYSCLMGWGAIVLRDTVCLNSGTAGRGLYMALGGNTSQASTARNVTAAATGSGSYGIEVDSGMSPGDTTSLTLDAKNVIAAGIAADVRAHTTGSSAATATLGVDYSNYDTEEQSGPGTEVATDPGSASNQMDPPLLAPDGYHQVGGSPTIDSGNAAASHLGTLDVDRETRVQNSAIDIGADEFLDSDGDAYPDSIDECPAVVGTIANAGCPEPPPPPDPGDTASPETALTGGPKDKTKKKTATFQFTGSDARQVSSFECSLDSGPFSACTSPHVVKVKKGKHNFQVRAVDAAGNADPTPAADAWKVKKKKK